MEDLDAIYNDNQDLKADFANMVKRGFCKSLFVRSASAILGEDWKNAGAKLLKDSPELMKKFSVYTKDAD